jgi:hypothetical protein
VQAHAHAKPHRVTGYSSVPLDVLLLRGHALGLPYLHSPTLCFLVYLSPSAYLSLQRSAPVATPAQSPTFDIPSTHLYNCLSADTPTKGVTRARLTLVPLSTLPRVPPSSADPLLSGRPSFPLAPNAIGFSYDFPLPSGPDAGKYGWVLAFGGIGGGIVMSQSRMLEIARVVQPHEQLSYTGTGPGLSFVTGSWVEMLVLYPYLILSLGCLADEVTFQLNSKDMLSPERYTATYVLLSGS